MITNNSKFNNKISIFRSKKINMVPTTNNNSTTKTILIKRDSKKD